MVTHPVGFRRAATWVITLATGGSRAAAGQPTRREALGARRAAAMSRRDRQSNPPSHVHKDGDDPSER